MRISTLHYKLRVLRPDFSASGSGAAAVAWREVGYCSAERVKLTGRRMLSAGEIVTDCDAMWRVRIEVPVKEGWRFEDSEGNLWEVTLPEPNIELELVTLKCVKVNP